jgi:hypothetical protein
MSRFLRSGGKRRTPRAERRRSVWEDPERVGPLAWLHRLIHPEDPASSELIINRNGEPQLVVERGHPVGYRCEDGSVRRFTVPPRDPAEWPEEAWGSNEPEWYPLRWRP